MLVALALVGFAANSLLCREALIAPAAIDAVTFATIRLISGAVVLMLLTGIGGGFQRPQGTWMSSLALFTYAIAFSLAYVRLTVGTGALLLFGAVQLTMMGAGLGAGERLKFLQWIGFALAVAGVVALSWRGVTAPDPFAAALMIAAGAAWGIYSLRGRGSRRPLVDTAGNFSRAVPFAVIASLIAFRGTHVSASGVLLAIISGALASGVGYSIWYAALPWISATTASIVQLAVPVLAAAGGIALLGEHLTARLIVAATAILSGVSLAVFSRGRPAPDKRETASELTSAATDARRPV